jgi:hypothetical protein
MSEPKGKDTTDRNAPSQTEKHSGNVHSFSTGDIVSVQPTPQPSYEAPNGGGHLREPKITSRPASASGFDYGGKKGKR